MKTFISILVIAISVYSCESTKDVTTARVTAGAGYSKLTNGDSWKGTIGGTVGGEIDFPISGGSSVGTGLNASFQGSKYEDTYYNGRVNLVYINLPLLYTYQALNGLYAEVGLQPGVVISAKDKYDGKSHDYKDAVKSFDLGIPVGAGYRFKNGIGVGLRVIPGLLNIDDTGDKMHNFLGMLLLSYRFWKGKQHK